MLLIFILFKINQKGRAIAMASVLEILFMVWELLSTFTRVYILYGYYSGADVKTQYVHIGTIRYLSIKSKILFVSHIIFTEIIQTCMIVCNKFGIVNKITKTSICFHSRRHNWEKNVT